VKALQAPFTINTMPEQTLLDFADHGEIGDLLPADGGNADQTPPCARWRPTHS